VSTLAKFIFRVIWFLVLSLIISVVTAVLGWFFVFVIFEHSFNFQAVMRCTFIASYLALCILLVVRTILWIIYLNWYLTKFNLNTSKNREIFAQYLNQNWDYAKQLVSIAVKYHTPLTIVDFTYKIIRSLSYTDLAIKHISRWEIQDIELFDVYTAFNSYHLEFEKDIDTWDKQKFQEWFKSKQDENAAKYRFNV